MRPRRSRRTRAGPRRAGRPGCRGRRSPGRRAPRPGGPIRPALVSGSTIIRLDELGELAHAVDVVAVVDDDADAAHVEQVEPAGRLEERRRERAQALADVVQVRARGPGRGRRRQRIGDVHPGAAPERRRDRGACRAPASSAAPRRRTISSPSARLEAERRVAATRVPVDPVEAVLALLGRHAEQHDPSGAVATHPVDVRVVGVEDGGPRARHGLHDDALDVRQLADRVDPAEAQVVAGDVGHDGHVVAVVAEALAQDAAARDLEDGGVDGRVLEDHLGRLRPGHVALLDEPAVDDDAVRRGHPTRRPMSLRMWAIIRTVVVLPFVPVTLMIGIREASPAGRVSR